MARQIFVLIILLVFSLYGHLLNSFLVKFNIGLCSLIRFLVRGPKFLILALPAQLVLEYRSVVDFVVLELMAGAYQCASKSK